MFVQTYDEDLQTFMGNELYTTVNYQRYIEAKLRAKTIE